ncbi:MAG: hypothetical protein HFI31_08850 [Lachnospiraceae bacterium]|jgi:hypothetical protein|nr:hypothetical protein [Lachnospiraceae bacterium]MCI8995443.1 hypothetical protein [Lachnospiraceae bacterium]MCI9134280.1 hypothetical protein [Lachnospiraceae bacterium]
MILSYHKTYVYGKMRYQVIHDFIDKGYLSQDKLIYTILDEETLAALSQELDSSSLW